MRILIQNFVKFLFSVDQETSCWHHQCKLYTYLLVFERELDEYLLQLFVHEVDAELFETVRLEYLEPVYI